MRRFYVGVTDLSWFDYLSSLGNLDEVNFWAPSTKSFKAINEGELFLFRLKSPRNVIGGFGTLSTAMNTTIDFAWNNLGVRNGMASLDDMVHSIGKYRKGLITDRHTEIGSKLISNPVFFDETDWFEAPSDWSRFIVSGKSYGLDDPISYQTLAALKERSNPRSFEMQKTDELVAPENFEEAVQFGTSLVKTRMGQGAFRYKVAKAYSLSCTFTGTSVTSILDAAHIKPISEGGSHDVTNSLFLRKDLHRLFDLGLITITTDYRIRLSPKIATAYGDVETYKNLDGQKISLPADACDNPSQNALAWHREITFKHQ